MQLPLTPIVPPQQVAGKQEPAAEADSKSRQRHHALSTAQPARLASV